MGKAKSLLSISIFLCLAAYVSRSHADEVNRKKLYQQTLRATVGVFASSSSGSGWVVDVEKKWLVTAQHVVGNLKVVYVVFPAFKGAKVVPERNFYVDKATRYRGRVLCTDSKRDLALLEMDEPLPAGVTSLKLAKESGESGDQLHLIGNPSASHAMWLYTSGTLRAVYKKKFTYKNTMHEVECIVGETQLPANPGDSGGPVVNDRGELLGVQASGTPDGVQLLTVYIDVGEVRTFLASPPKQPIKPKNVAEYYARGLHYYHLARWDLALDDFTSAIALDPKHGPSYRERGGVHLKQQRHDLAILDCTRAIEINPDDALAYNVRGVSHDARREYAKAIADFSDSLRINPQDCVTLLNRSHTYTRQKNYDGAIRDCTEAIRLDPKMAPVWRSRGVAHADKGQHEKAIADYTEAIRLNPADATAFLWRSWAQASFGNDAAAAADRKEAQRLEGLANIRNK